MGLRAGDVTCVGKRLDHSVQTDVSVTLGKVSADMGLIYLSLASGDVWRSQRQAWAECTYSLVSYGTVAEQSSWVDRQNVRSGMN